MDNDTINLVQVNDEQLKKFYLLLDMYVKQKGIEELATVVDLFNCLSRFNKIKDQ
jgi:hypothetical protein